VDSITFQLLSCVFDISVALIQTSPIVPFGKYLVLTGLLKVVQLTINQRDGTQDKQTDWPVLSGFQNNETSTYKSRRFWAMLT
jgi:hypothetical protein